MIKYPQNIDDDESLPQLNDNISEIRADDINPIKDAVIAIETALGINPQGTEDSLSKRIEKSINPDGSIRSSALTTAGLLVAPIKDESIDDNAKIKESKLDLDHSTSDLNNLLLDTKSKAEQALNWQSSTGTKINPHINGSNFNHYMSHILVSSPDGYFYNKLNLLRNNSNLYLLTKDINDEFLYHQFADGTGTSLTSVTTNSGSSYPSTFAHTASGIYLNTSRFISVPQTANDLQQFADYIDNSSLFLFGSRIQNLYSNGISRVSTSSVLNNDGYGQNIIPPTKATTYFLNLGANSSPFDDIDTGDDIIELKPSASLLSSNIFDSQFSLLKPGDIVKVNYGGVEVQFFLKEKKYVQNGLNKKFIIRVSGKNIKYTQNASVRIDRALANNNKYGVLAVSSANNPDSSLTQPSLIVTSPRSAQALGLNFNPDQFDETHCLLYLVLYPNGNIEESTLLPAIDVTGNQGTTPGKYTLSGIVQTTNDAFRKAGYNFRFNAFSYHGEFGIALSDTCNNAAFSIISADIDSSGVIDEALTNINYPNNVVGTFNTGTLTANDPLGFGVFNANIASPPYKSSYSSPEQSIQATKLFVSHKRNNFYVNGVEKDKLSLDVDQNIDNYGDGYWVGYVLNAPSVFPGPPGRVSTTYRVNLDLSTSNLKEGKTLIVQSLNQGSLIDFGRFIIQSITFGCGVNGYTDIQVYDSVHANGFSPETTLGQDGYVALYFDQSSVSFNKESSTDFVAISPFKRHFEVYTSGDGNVFTHERGRINSSGSDILVNTVTLRSTTQTSKMNLVKVSSKLRGYQFYSIYKVSLRILNYSSSSGVYSGYLCYYDGTNYKNKGSVVFGVKGNVTRFYDESNTNYVDIVFDINENILDFSDEVIDIQLFPSLSMDTELMLLSTCQVDDITNKVSYLRDERQFGTTSEKDFTTSALNFISAPQRLLNGNGVIRGFDLEDLASDPNPNGNQLYLTGGLVLVNGKFIQMNNQTVVLPVVKELYISTLYNINWAICVNDKGEYEPIPLLDYDASISNPNASRLFLAFNMVTGNSYYIESAYFSDIINNRKDLAILYIVSSNVVAGSPPTVTLSVTDARRYLNDSDTNLPLKLTNANAQGNFKSVQSIFNWIKFNNQYNSKAFVNGANATTGVVSNSIRFDFLSETVIEGENNAELTMNNEVVIGSNITFRGLKITFNGGLSSVPGLKNVLFDNCVLIINNPSTPTNNVLFDMTNGNNIIFKDTDISVVYNGKYDGGAVFKLNGVSDFVFTGNTLNVSFDIDSGNYYPGTIFDITNSPNVKIDDCYFSGNFNQCVNVNSGTNSKSLTITNTKVQSLYSPFDFQNTSTPDLSYDSSKLVNTGYGYIHLYTSAVLEDITIDNVEFTYFPVYDNPNRFSFINFELNGVSSGYRNVRIANCKFNDQYYDASIDGYNPAISIINKTGVAANTSTRPFLSNFTITKNVCNRNQSIIISSKTTSSGLMAYPGLVAQNCLIENNICGVIGYWVSASNKVVSIPPNISTSGNDKTSQLTIQNNVCHYIGTVDSYGKFFMVSRNESNVTFNKSQYPSGYVTIKSNKANWIHVGIAFEDSSSLQILDNDLCAYDDSFLDKFEYSTTNFGTTDIYPAILVTANKHELGVFGQRNDSNVLIHGNITNSGTWLQSTSTFTTYRYSGGYVLCLSSSTITDNIFKGMDSGTTAIRVGGMMNIFKENKVYRNDLSIDSYFKFANYEKPANWDGDGSFGIVTDNYFDSPQIISTTSAADDNIINLQDFNGFTTRYPNAKSWVITENINQTGYLLLPLTNAQMVLGDNGFDYSYPTDYYLKMAPDISDVGRSYVMRMHDEATVSTRVINWQESIDKYLPKGSKLLKAKIGVKTFGSQVSYPTLINLLAHPSFISLTVARYGTSKNYTNLDYFTGTPTGSPPYASGIADNMILNDAVSLDNSQVITGAEINAASSTLYAEVNYQDYGGSDITEDYRAGNDNSFAAILHIDVRRTTGVDLDLYFSPVLIKYRW